MISNKTYKELKAAEVGKDAMENISQALLKQLGLLGNAPARQKMWWWIVRGLQGPKSTPGPYFYLTQQVNTFDIQRLVKRLTDVLEVLTMCSLAYEVKSVTHLEFDPPEGAVHLLMSGAR